MSATPQQRDAIQARGNILVMAGAGTGKTRTLVERCLDILTHDVPRVHLDEMLIVTFTEAAAAEMRERIRKRLEQQQAAHPEDPHWSEQIALFETAHIGTLHSYCFKLIRQHFYELGLDPQLAILTEHESAVLAGTTLEDVLGEHYEGEGEFAEAVRRLVLDHGNAGSDANIRVLVRQIHRYAQSVGEPDSWFDDQLEHFRQTDPSIWTDWLAAGFEQWRQLWQPRLERFATGGQNPVASQAAAALANAVPSSTGAQTLAVIAAAAQGVLQAKDDCQYGKKKLWVEPLEPVFDEAEFFASLLSPDGSPGPLAQDWEWMRQPVLTLLEVARQFGIRFLEAKRALGVLDFGDLEQYALRLLWDFPGNQPTALARSVREQLRFVFVDEYQDINVAQDRIIAALARDGAEANRFLVGDVKQSIYRFRLAAPRIFQGYARAWSAGAERVIPLSENFRSREAILDFVNPVFALLMRQELGGVAYDDDARLRFGAPQQREGLSRQTGHTPRVQLHVLLRETANSPEEPAEDDPAGELEAAAREARLVALQLRQLRESGTQVWDEAQEAMRPVEWRDIAILLRAPGRKTGAYATQFAALGVPLQVMRGGFFQSIEVGDLLSLLQVLDNPLQDIPLVAVLHSPLAGLTAAELATVRARTRRSRFWVAVTRFASEKDPVSDDAALAAKVDLFLERFARWRRLARQSSLSICLETILTETAYADWLLTQPEGRQRYANVRRLISLAREFDRFQRQGLFRFVNFVQSQLDLESDPEVPRAAQTDAVRLMSIHQSKGLEFPVVVLADIAKQFNEQDLRSDLVFDEQYGVCGKVKAPGSGRRYPSLPLWLARRRQSRELRGEELRLLYVAMTRARDALLLVGTLRDSELAKKFAPAEPEDFTLARARSYADWLGLWFGSRFSFSAGTQGADALVSWQVHDRASLQAGDGPTPGLPDTSEDLPPDVFHDLYDRLNWRYAHTEACARPAKTSVSLLRRMADVDEEASSDAIRITPVRGAARVHRQPVRAAEIGTLHHQFLEQLDVRRTNTAAELRAEAARLASAGLLPGTDLARLDFGGLAAFWQTDLARRIRSAPECLRRELAFTARFAPSELAEVTGQGVPAGMGEEFVIVQGVADMVLVDPEGLTLIDFKTDRAPDGGWAEKIRTYTPQLVLYARALERTFGQRVTRACLYFLDTRELVDVVV